MESGCLVSTKEMAEVFGVTRRAIGQFVESGMPKVELGKFYLPECVQWLLDRRTEPEESRNLRNQRLKLILAQTEKTEIDIKIRRDGLIELTEVSHVINELTMIFTSQLDPIGSRLAPDLVGLTDTAEIKERIDDETRQVRASVADIVEAWADNPDSSIDNSAAPRAT